MYTCGEKARRHYKAKMTKRLRSLTMGGRYAGIHSFNFMFATLHEKAGGGIKQNKCILKIPLCLWLFLFFKILLNYNSHNIKFTFESVHFSGC